MFFIPEIITFKPCLVKSTKDATHASNIRVVPPHGQPNPSYSLNANLVALALILFHLFIFSIQ